MGQAKVSVDLETVAKAQEELAKIKDGCRLSRELTPYPQIKMTPLSWLF